MSYSLQEFQSIKMYHCAYQGPCPRGFHIGSKAEWEDLINALTTLGVYNVSDIPTVLNIPSAYYLARSNGSLETRYGICRFWTSTMTSNTVAWAWGIDQNPTLIFQEDKPGNAFSIRPFKDEPVIPDSNWTEFPYGVFKNTTLGLISIQNASNWITISDKNLGATNVGDKGLFYQFGNNHGFTVNPTPYYTSKVSNTQAYGPNNYYNDEHFVRVSSGNNWFTDTNNNIRGGVDTSSLYPTEAKEVWLGNHRVRPTGWQPGANTIAYYPLNSTYTNTDQSGNNRNGTTTGTLSYDSISCQFTSGNYINIPTSIPYGSNPFTISIWFNSPDVSGHQNWFYNQFNSSTNNTAIGLFIYSGSLNFWSKGPNDWSNIYSVSANTRYNAIITYDGSTLTGYVNGTQASTKSRTIGTTTPNYAWIGCGGEYSGRVYCIAKLSNMIIENKVWTAQEVSDYYNQTKGDYGL